MQVSHRFRIERPRRFSRSAAVSHCYIWGLKPGDRVIALEVLHDGRLAETIELTCEHLLIGHSVYDAVGWMAVQGATTITDRMTVTIAVVMPGNDGYIWLNDQLAPRAYRDDYMAPILEALPGLRKWLS